ncbi:hypothetical protein KBC75_04870 [Candidatus Shapirobacteria bacterium]|nr:hypothetical protein [Candidatus Shapirobacteria bacterium]
MVCHSPPFSKGCSKTPCATGDTEINSIAHKLFQEFNPHTKISSPKAKFIQKANSENYGLRWFDKRRYKDIFSLVTIDKQPILLQFLFPKTPSKLRYYRDVFNSSQKHSQDHFYVFAITDLTNEIIGWVQYTPDVNVSQLRKITKISRGSLVFEVSYAKLFTPNNRYVAVNGLKQSLETIRTIDNHKSKEVYLTGYTDPLNSASEAVLKNNGFIKLSHQIPYENELSNIWLLKIN